MKNYFLILFCFCSLSLFSQIYKFDFVTKYSSEQSIGKITYTNSENENIFLTVFYNYEGELIAYIQDLENNFFHYLTVEYKEKEVFFKYKNSKKVKLYKDQFSHHEFDYIETPIDSLKSKLIINSYKNKKRKKPLHTIELEVIRFNSNKFSNFRKSMHLYENRKDFNPNKNFLVLSYQFKNLSKVYLTEFKNVDISINIKQIVLQ